MNKTLVILNPAARGERAARLRGKLQALAEVRLTGGPGDAQAMAALAVEEGYDTVVAAGGDGTINEVVNGLAGSGVTLGLLPHRHDEHLCGGTRRAEQTNFGVAGRSSRPVSRVRWMLRRPTSGPSFNLPGLVSTRRAVAGVDWQFKKNFGPLSYLISAAKVASRKPPALLIDTDDGQTREGSFVLVGNGRYYAAPVAVFKQAVIDDGLLDGARFQEFRIFGHHPVCAERDLRHAPGVIRRGLFPDAESHRAPAA